MSIFSAVQRLRCVGAVGLVVVLASCDVPEAFGRRSSSAQRGQYLVEFGGCHDCHTPKVMTASGPVPDSALALSGHPEDATLPPFPAEALAPGRWGAVTNDQLTAWAGPWGVSFAANLTPDPSGLGSWTEEQFVQTMRTGRHRGVGRPLLPPMPWFNLAALSDRDLRAVYAYLRTLPPIQNRVPAPIPPGGAAPAE